MHLDAMRLTAYLHVLLFAYWIGSDLGVMTTGLVANRRGTSEDAKRGLREAGVLIDMAPRTCLVMMIPVGFTLATLYGSPIRGVALMLLWILGFAWVWLVWMVHLKERTPLGKIFWNIDFVLRAAGMVGFIGFGAYCLISGGPIAGAWLPLKMILFGGCLLLGLVIRVMLLRAHRPVAHPTVQAGGVAAAPPFLSPIRMVVFGIWGLVLAAAFLGVVKPF